MKTRMLTIPMPIYRLHVIVCWDMTIREVGIQCRKRGCELVTDEWIRDTERLADGANGLCANLGPGNTDVLVWLKHDLNRRSKASEFGVLYHELFHAVDRITKSHNLEGEEECRAYIYEWLATECNRYFWSRK